MKFDDATGVGIGGMWYARIEVLSEMLSSDSKTPPTDFNHLSSVANMSAVAIPLHYIVGRESENAGKFCVLTNWWKERARDGNYRLPSIDSTLYSRQGNIRDDEEDPEINMNNVI